MRWIAEALSASVPSLLFILKVDSPLTQVESLFMTTNKVAPGNGTMSLGRASALLQLHLGRRAMREPADEPAFRVCFGYWVQLNPY